jgi:hypothetical protein
MLRLLLASALGALLLSAAPLTAQITPDMIGGRMRGTWDLPNGDQPGRVRGVMVYLGEVVVGLEARLTPMPMPGDVRGGRMDGILRRKTDTGFATETLAEVHGTFLVSPDGTGAFEAVIVPPEVLGVRPDPIGKMAGVFADPKVGDKNTIGRFTGRWAVRL